MSEKGFFASICSFFSGLFSSDSGQSNTAAASAPSNSGGGLTGVERYIRSQATKATTLTGVESYIRNQADAKPLTGVESYIQNQASSQSLTGVEKYIRSQG
jgi:hypothetical protein